MFFKMKSDAYVPEIATRIHTNKYKQHSKCKTKDVLGWIDLNVFDRVP